MLKAPLSSPNRLLEYVFDVKTRGDEFDRVLVLHRNLMYRVGMLTRWYSGYMCDPNGQKPKIISLPVLNYVEILDKNELAPRENVKVSKVTLFKTRKFADEIITLRTAFDKEVSEQGMEEED